MLPTIVILALIFRCRVAGRIEAGSGTAGACPIMVIAHWWFVAFFLRAAN
jgi:hypothetical protein